MGQMGAGFTMYQPPPAPGRRRASISPDAFGAGQGMAALGRGLGQGFEAFGRNLARGMEVNRDQRFRKKMFELQKEHDRDMQDARFGHDEALLKQRILADFVKEESVTQREIIKLEFQLKTARIQENRELMSELAKQILELRLKLSDRIAGIRMAFLNTLREKGAMETTMKMQNYQDVRATLDDLLKKPFSDLNWGNTLENLGRDAEGTYSEARAVEDFSKLFGDTLDWATNKLGGSQVARQTAEALVAEHFKYLLAKSKAQGWKLGPEEAHDLLSREVKPVIEERAGFNMEDPNVLDTYVMDTIKKSPQWATKLPAEELGKVWENFEPIKNELESSIADYQKSVIKSFNDAADQTEKLTGGLRQEISATYAEQFRRVFGSDDPEVQKETEDFLGRFNIREPLVKPRPVGPTQGPAMPAGAQLGPQRPTSVQQPTLEQTRDEIFQTLARRGAPGGASISPYQAPPVGGPATRPATQPPTQPSTQPASTQPVGIPETKVPKLSNSDVEKLDRIMSSGAPKVGTLSEAAATYGPQAYGAVKNLISAPFRPGGFETAATAGPPVLPRDIAYPGIRELRLLGTGYPRGAISPEEPGWLPRLTPPPGFVPNPYDFEEVRPR